MKDQAVGTIISLQVGQPQTVGSRESSDRFDEVWTTGFFKLPITDPVWLGTTNLNGDGQADLKNHGGPEKAVNVYPVEHYPYCNRCWERPISFRIVWGKFHHRRAA